MGTIRRAGVLAAGLAAAVAVGCGEAKISTDCTMNGFGTGSCQFTNTGDRSGSVCGRIVVQRTELDSATQSKLSHLAAASSRESGETGVSVGETKSWKERENLRNQAIANLPHVESELFCSGDVGSRETKTVQFTVAGVRDMCDPSDRDDSWGDVCAFSFGVAE